MKIQNLDQETTMIQLPAQLLLPKCPTYRMALMRVVDEGFIKVVVDMREVEFIDSSGLAVLLTLLNKTSRHGGHMVLLDPPRGVRSLLELTRLTQVFTIYQDLHAAVQGLKKACNETHHA